ncbi:MAG: alpha-glucan family phosphorylase [Chloroflexi bacterium]|nr:alpha-glucan family phosphorylase [Chloroflexota bacterium]
MAHDFSWTASAAGYVELYQKAIADKERVIQAARALAEDIQRTADKIAALPPRLARLGELAYNLWWTCHPFGRKVFQDIDPAVWQRVRYNAVKFLREVGPEKLDAASVNPEYLKRYDSALAAFDQYRQAKATWFNTTYPYFGDQPIAYFCAEFGLHESLPIYGGGLGILAGDHTKEASDLGLPFVGIGFLYPQGYFTQRLTADGWQEALYEKLNFALAPAVPAKGADGNEIVISVELPGRTIYAKVWRIQAGRVPLFLMDTDVDANAPADRELAARLYGGDHEIRISQEIVLGIGGVRALRALGFEPSVYHLNEGHSAFSVLERARELVARGLTFDAARETIRASTVFTTHTPVPAGNDAFSFDLMEKYFANFWKQLGLTREQFLDLAWQDLPGGPRFSLTVLALRFSDAANGVSELHGAVSRGMWHFLWPDRAENETPIGHITNGVHLGTWLAPEYQALYDEYLGRDWRERMDDPGLWSAVANVPDEKLWNVHLGLKRHLANYIRNLTQTRGGEIKPDALTLGFARRFATYKRAVLMFRNVERLKRILNSTDCPVQIIFSGKAHPADNPGKEFIREVVQLVETPGLKGRLFFVEDYDLAIARHLVQGVDVWTNTPRRPLEASGTSGQKAALNGVPNFSVLDGWWREGYISGLNGWPIGADQAWDDVNAQDAADAESFYATLENDIVPLYYNRDADGIPHAWVQLMKHTMRTLAPKFITRRMVKEYVTKYYIPAATR